VSAGSRLLDVAVPIGIGRARGVAALGGGGVADGGVAEEGVEGGDEFAPSDDLAPLDTGDRSNAFEVAGTATTTAVLLLGIASAALLHTSPSDRYLPSRRPAPAFPYPQPRRKAGTVRAGRGGRVDHGNGRCHM
jgi:hypothetical protein